MTPFDKASASVTDRIAWALCQIIDDDAPLRWTRYRFAAECIAKNPDVMADLVQLRGPSPTPGDLSARQVEVLQRLLDCHGNHTVIDDDDASALTEAIAALSALPAAGGAYPIQPLAFDEKGVLRFRVNTLVRHLLDNGGLTMNDLATVDCPTEEREQFAQLIGYSLGGFGTLSYVTDETYERAVATTPQPSAAEEKES